MAALASLREDELALGAVLGEVRAVLETSAADQAMSELYVATARERLKQVAQTLADPGADLAGRSFLARLWWVDELLTALVQARTSRAGIASLGSDGGVALLDEDPPNLPPVAQDDGYELKHDTTLSVPAPGVMTNDYDPLADPITASLVSGPSHAASFTFGSDGSFTYTPSYHFVGTD
ncbi:MAG: Ig-like domain-containing protein, partial [Thermoguttaceae bacterium]|nr:Ig-like domain-containing protein [Thermoguttaceae bacterium]